MNIGKTAFILVAALAAAASLSAAELEDSGVESFRPGRFNKTALDYRGYITAAPALERILETDQPFIWCVAPLADGRLAAGCGNDSSVIRFAEDGTIHDHVSLGGLGIMSLLPLLDGGFLAGGAPNGSVYRFDQTGGKLLVSTGSQYVWCMIRRGEELLVGTGPGGQVIRLDESDPQIMEIIAEVDESHILSMAVGRDGTLYLGVSETGTIYAVPASGGSPRILARLTRADVRSLLVHDDGYLVAVVAGEAPAETAGGREDQETADKTGDDDDSEPVSGASVSGEPKTKNKTVNSEPESAENGPETTPEEDESEGAPAVSGVTGEGDGAVCEVGLDGRVTVLAEFEEMILSAALAEDGWIIAGGAEKGRLYRIDRRGNVIYLGRVGSEQIPDIQPLSGGRYLLAGGNPGAVWVLDGAAAASGTFTSRVLDAGSHAYWGTVEWVGWTPAATAVRVSTRSGHKPRADDTWSVWEPAGPAPNNLVASPPARYLQYRLELVSGGGKKPSVHRVTVSYRKPNQPPRIKIPAVTFPLPRPPGNGNGEESPPYRAAMSWEATDVNEDPLLFDLSLVSERYDFRHRLTKDSLGQASFNWDSRGIPDGWYRISVVASDRTRWGPADAMTGEAVSVPFVVDNTPPEVTVRKSSVHPRRGIWTVTVHCEDALSIIHGARVSLDGGKWETALPADGLFDSRSETLIWSSEGCSEFEDSSPGGHSLMIQCWDKRGNTGAGGTVVPGGE